MRFHVHGRPPAAADRVTQFRVGPSAQRRLSSALCAECEVLFCPQFVCVHINVLIYIMRDNVSDVPSQLLNILNIHYI